MKHPFRARSRERLEIQIEKFSWLEPFVTCQISVRFPSCGHQNVEEKKVVKKVDIMFWPVRSFFSKKKKKKMNIPTRTLTCHLVSPIGWTIHQTPSVEAVKRLLVKDQQVDISRNETSVEFISWLLKSSEPTNFRAACRTGGLAGQRTNLRGQLGFLFLVPRPRRLKETGGPGAQLEFALQLCTRYLEARLLLSNFA